MDYRKMFSFGPCIPCLLIGVVIGAMLGPVRYNNQPWSIWDFSAPIGGVIGVILGEVANKIDKAITAADQTSVDPPT